MEFDILEVRALEDFREATCVCKQNKHWVYRALQGQDTKVYIEVIDMMIDMSRI